MELAFRGENAAVLGRLAGWIELQGESSAPSHFVILGGEKNLGALKREMRRGAQNDKK